MGRYRVIIFFVLISLVLSCPLNDDYKGGLMYTPEILVLPSKTVTVGQEVYFSAYPENYRDMTIYNRFKWKFGDEDQGFDDYVNLFKWEHGATTVHYYRKPGVYTVSCTVTDVQDGSTDPQYSKTAYTEIEVTGPPRNGLFELYFADFQARISQFCYVKASDDARKAAYVEVDITGEKGYSKALLYAPLHRGDELEFVLENALLPRDFYTIEARLYDTSGRQVDTIIEYYNKPYTGFPRVGIDKWNNICLEGSPVFVIGAAQLSKAQFDWWGDRFVNASYDEGYIEYNNDGAGTWADHQPESFTNYLDQAAIDGVWVIGPEVYSGKGGMNMQGIFSTNWERNTNPYLIRKYIDYGKNKPALIAWCWDDEPNMGEAWSFIPASVVRSWTALTHMNDHNHPVALNYFGAVYLPYYADDSWRRRMSDTFDYMKNDWYFGKKTLPSDILGLDIYPVWDQNQTTLNTPAGRTSMDVYIEALHRIQDRNHNLTPIMVYVETTDIDPSAGRPEPGPTYEQIMMMGWMNVINGAKGVIWFQYFAPIPEHGYRGMHDFYKAIKTLSQVITSPPVDITVTDTSDVRGSRVDTMLRETPEAYWLFAVRVTELDDTATEPTENTTFTLNGVNVSGSAEVFDEGRSVTVSGGSFTDSFAPEAWHVYKIPK